MLGDMDEVPVLDDVLSVETRISQFAKKGILRRIASAIRQRFFLSRIPRDADPIAGCWMAYLGMINGSRVLLRRNEAVRRFVGDPSLPFCLAVRVAFTPVDEDGLAYKDGPAFDRFEFAVRDAICLSKLGLHAATITLRGVRLFVYYCKEPRTQEQLLQSIEIPFDTGQVSVKCERDDEWTFFRAIA